MAPILIQTLCASFDRLTFLCCHKRQCLTCHPHPSPTHHTQPQKRFYSPTSLTATAAKTNQWIAGLIVGTTPQVLSLPGLVMLSPVPCCLWILSCIFLPICACQALFAPCLLPLASCVLPLLTESDLMLYQLFQSPGGKAAQFWWQKILPNRWCKLSRFTPKLQSNSAVLTHLGMRGTRI